MKRNKLVMGWKLIKTEGILSSIGIAFNILKYAVLKVSNTKLVKKRIHNYQMYLKVDDPGISRSLILIGDREKEHKYFLEHLLEKGDTVLDIGGNIGYYTLMQAKMVGKTGKVISIEPEKSNYQLLQKNIALNKLKHITTMNNAVGIKEETKALHLSRKSNLHSFVANDKVNAATGKQQMVKVLEINKLVAKYSPKLIRMDLEGFEVEILDSISKAKKQPDNILFETHPKRYDFERVSDICIQLQKKGYKMKYVAMYDKHAIPEHIDIVAEIPSDGEVRHIVQDIDLVEAIPLFHKSRAVVIGK